MLEIQKPLKTPARNFNTATNFTGICILIENPNSQQSAPFNVGTQNTEDTLCHVSVNINALFIYCYCIGCYVHNGVFIPYATVTLSYWKSP